VTKLTERLLIQRDWKTMAEQEIDDPDEPQNKRKKGYDYGIILRSALEGYSIPKSTFNK
jgi:hypothetical protein